MAGESGYSPLGAIQNVPGDPYFADVSDTSDPGTEKTFLEVVTVANEEINLVKVLLNTPLIGILRVYEDATVIGRKQGTPSMTDMSIFWPRFRPVGNGATLKVTYEACVRVNVSVDISLHVMGSRIAP